MPELPEVEVVKRYLSQEILNKRIEKIEFYFSNILKNINENVFIENVINNKIINIKRIGKYLFFILEDNSCFVSHFRMEGKFFLEDQKKYLRQKHDHLFIFLEDDKLLIFNDFRKFGTIEYYSVFDETKFKQDKKLGFEPSDISLDFVVQKFKNKNKNIKNALLDQSIFLGIGNIYANEILFDTKINPLKKIGSLSKKQINLLIKSSIAILDEAIKNNGTTISTFSFAKDEHGNFQNLLKVHGREGLKCYVCGNVIIKEKVNGRGAYFCNTCQKN